MTFRFRPIAAALVLCAALPFTAADAAVSGIRRIDFRNGFTYEGGYGPIIVRGGEYSNNSEQAREFFKVVDVDYGDLDGDGGEEAIVTTLNNTGGTGNITDGLVYGTRAGKARLITSLGSGDRADGGIHEISIARGRVVVDRYGGNGGSCCPEFIERQVLVLQRGRTVPVGKVAKRAFINLDDAATAQTEIKFLPGGTSATVVGFADGQLRGHFFEANAGQTLRITVPPVRDGKRFTVGVRQGGGLVGSVSSGATLVRRLDVTDAYTITLSMSPPPPPDAAASATFDIEIR